MSEGKVRFQREGGDLFYVAVKERVRSYFTEKGISPNTNFAMVMKSIVITSVYLLIYFWIISGMALGGWLLVAYALFGFLQSLVGFNIAHDALHGAYSASPNINRWIGYFFDLNGESSLMWKMTHNGLHHTYTNIAGMDEDINKEWILRFSPHAPWYPFHRYQAFYAPLLYGLVSLNWVFWGDWVGIKEAFSQGKVSSKDLVIFLVFKALNLIVMVFLPWAMSGAPLWLILLGLLCMHFTAGVTISFVFQLAHLVEGVEFPLPKDGVIREEWAIHEMRTTSNFATANRVLSWFLGGLNFQVEHHLFPRVCHVHYPEIHRILKKTAEDMNVPYNEKKDLFSALRSHLSLLHKFGQKPPMKL